jgi:oligosaccharide reducing-end xylanase
MLYAAPTSTGAEQLNPGFTEAVGIVGVGSNPTVYTAVGANEGIQVLVSDAVRSIAGATKLKLIGISASVATRVSVEVIQAAEPTCTPFYAFNLVPGQTDYEILLSDTSALHADAGVKPALHPTAAQLASALTKVTGIRLRAFVKTTSGNATFSMSRIEVNATVTAAPAPPPAPIPSATAAFTSGVYRNLFAEANATRDAAAVTARLNALWDYFFVNPATTIYYSNSTEAYVRTQYNDGKKDIDDVRSEGMSYAMMLSVQMDKRADFDKLWTWSKTYMRHPVGHPQAGRFAWNCKPGFGSTATKNANGSAPDGEIWFAMALFFAANRWNDATLRADANEVLRVMLHTGAEGTAFVPYFHPTTNLVRFVPETYGENFTDPSYAMAGFYDLFSRWASVPVDQARWAQIAAAGRDLLHNSANATTGLSPGNSEFNGASHAGNQANYEYDAWRVQMARSMDWSWFKADNREVQDANRLTQFMASGAVTNLSDTLALNAASPLQAGGTSQGHIAMLATAGLCYDAGTSPEANKLINEAWNKGAGPRRDYYSGLLLFIGTMLAGGQFKIWK